jgi:hypothetical protein
MATESRATFVVRWLDGAGLLARHKSHRPEVILVLEHLQPQRTARGWRMAREEGSVLGPIDIAEGEARE